MRACDAGLLDRLVPAPPLGAYWAGPRTGWDQLYVDHITRFEPFQRDAATLLRTRLIPYPEDLRTLAPCQFREPDHKGEPAGIWETDSTIMELNLRQYFAEFLYLALDLWRLREDWLDKVPDHDPMRVDEVEFRILEAEVFTNLDARGAAILTLRSVHTSPCRRYTLKDGMERPRTPKFRRAFFTHLLSTLEAM